MQIHVDAAAHFSAFMRSLRLLRTPRFGTYYVATLLSNIGTWSQQIAEPWLLLSLGASSFLIGLDAFVQAAPAWMLILAGGILADRADRRVVITTFQAIQMMCPIILVALLLTNSVEPWMVVVLSLVVGVTDAISMPSFQTIAPSIVRHSNTAMEHRNRCTDLRHPELLATSLLKCPRQVCCETPSETKKIGKLSPLSSFIFLTLRGIPDSIPSCQAG
jgi:hypothetical protein